MSEHDKNDPVNDQDNPQEQDETEIREEWQEQDDSHDESETVVHEAAVPQKKVVEEELVVGGSSAPDGREERNPALLYAAIGGGVLVLILLGLFFFTGGEEEPEEQPVEPAVATTEVEPAPIVPEATLAEPEEVVVWDPGNFQVPASQQVQDIRRALERAEEQIAAGNLIEPDNNNALASYLSVLEAEPDNAQAQAGRDQVATLLVEQANQALAEGRISDALQMESAVETVRPDTPGLAGLQAQLATQNGVIELLGAASEDLQADRLITPEGDNALAKYVQVLALNPNVVDAQQGLENVELALLENATEAARNLDFAAAEEMLTSAEGVREGEGAVAETRENILAFRNATLEQITGEVEAAIAAANKEQAQSLIAQMEQIAPQDERIAQLKGQLESAPPPEPAGPSDEDMARFDQLVADARTAIEARDYAGAGALLDEAAALLPERADELTTVRQDLTKARVYAQYDPGDTFQDEFVNRSGAGPTMVVMPIGNYLMGSPESEQGRRSYEGPVHQVTFTDAFAVSQTEISVDQFRQFVNMTGYATDADRDGETSIYSEDTGSMEADRGVDWSDDFRGERADGDLPVIHISWNDASAYAQWLSQVTGQPYRLLSEAEFEYALRSGSRSPYWWGLGAPEREVENLTGEDDLSEAGRSWTVAFDDYDDEYWGPAPVAEFAANPFGLFDMGGNVSEWVADCWHDSYARAPTDGSAWVNPGCGRRVVRGAAWLSPPERARSAYRISASADTHTTQVGFRIARDL